MTPAGAPPRAKEPAGAGSPRGPGPADAVSSPREQGPTGVPAAADAVSQPARQSAADADAARPAQGAGRFRWAYVALVAVVLGLFVMRARITTSPTSVKPPTTASDSAHGAGGGQSDGSTATGGSSTVTGGGSTVTGGGSATSEGTSADDNGRASVTLKTVPSGATVSVDGRPRGTTPLTVEALKPGLHRLEFTHSEAAPLEYALDLAAGDHPTLTLALHRR